ncbi:MAG TPA: CocE/NonD family hydrolase [Candidatus Udaeobacter sp.]|nr:CocE/NonD family hydrolase [Candidatus Udaeobacter sp.]
MKFQDFLRSRIISSWSILAATHCSVFATIVVAQTPTGTPSPSEPLADYDLRWGVKIPMRDKVELNATLYLPRTPDGSSPKTPVIFTLTPYISDSYHARGAYFALHGYAFLLVDVRGRGNSAGEFEPFVNDPRDGHDLVEWFAKQPYCDGKVAMWGGSYAGFDQWATAKEFPPHLATIVPAAAAHPGLDYPSTENVGLTYDMQWFTFTSGRTGQDNLFADQKFWRAKFLDAYKKHIPFKSLDSFVGNPSVNFQRIVKHPTLDAYYDAMVPTREQFQKIMLPILTITAQYDGDELGALSYYRDHLANASPEARAKHFLIIGPWDHAGTRTPTAEVAGVKFGPASVIDLNDLHRQWYDWTMKNGPKPEFLKNQIAYYLLAPGNSGANGEWKYADNLETLVASPKIFYLDSKNGDANGVFRSGSLAEKQPTDGSDTFVYDPLDTTRGETVDGLDPKEKTAGLDQTYPLSIGKDGLVYHTGRLPKETPLIGCPAATLWLSIDTPDVDLSAYLYEIQPDGTSIVLWSDTRRLRYRNSLREAKLVKPGEIVRCDLNPGLFVARRLMKGSRLRLVVSSPNSIHWQKNYCSGGVVAEETAKDARTCHVQVYHDATHPSTIQLPLR